MDRGFAVDHFGFPALPRRGERHTAPDGSVWEFALTGTDWWELSEYAPGEADRSIAAEALADALKREGDRKSSIGFYRDRYWLPIAERLIADGWRPPSPRRADGPNHSCPPGTGHTVAPKAGYFVGYIAELDDDSQGEQLMEFSGTVHRTKEAAREDWEDAQAWRPGWRLYHLTDITERPSE
jgi:hypothetical protein